ncbi:DUF4422 domain-containing protein [Gluconobacter kondonii]|uniref:DUF4422 domain-containing protein n=1 Tax=Gluconobacter kondonii TaxID=941463 RepID=UPI001B8B34DE|nr:DUF4422 domain-containing protein [Gluconobacter kondonii]MBS1055095.1 DUF4422 domain-containing protein [Gluconobacter kondonii]
MEKITMCRLKIFRVTHQINEEENYISNNIFSDFIIGQKSKDNSFFGDLDSDDNISSEHTHSEMRAHYYIWKNHIKDYDYIGFEHFKRLLYVDYIPASELIEKHPILLYLRKKIEKNQNDEIFHDRIAYNEALNIRIENNEEYNKKLIKKVSEYDIICVRSQNISTKSSLCDDNILEHVFSSCSYFKNNPMLVDFDHTTTNYRCSFIMKKNYFCEYMDFWYEIVKKLEKILNKDPRELGYYSEKIFSYYLFQKKMENPLIRVNSVPMLSR